MRNEDVQTLRKYRQTIIEQIVTNGVGYRDSFYDSLLKKPTVNERWLQEYLEYMVPSYPSIQRIREIKERSLAFSLKSQATEA